MTLYSILGNRRRGSAMVMFTLMIPTVIIPMVGLGIDATMLYIVQAKLSAAVDGAALGAGRLLGTPADPAEIAGEFLKANFRTDNTAGFWGANNLVPTVTVTLGTTKTIQVVATADVPLLFSRVFGQQKATVAAAATATRRDSRIILVIDRSQSMTESDGNGSTAIADVISYAQSFVGKFTNGTDEMGLVVYDGSAVVGYPTVRPWDSTTKATSTGGPNSTFADGSNGDMLHQIRAIKAGGYTGIGDALWVAYIELQKAHMKDLAAHGGIDDRLNAIVLFTDGAPTAVSLYLNNTANGGVDNMIKSSSACTYKTSSTTKMLGWFAIYGPPFSTSTSTGLGMFLMASTDPASAHTAAWWMANGGQDQATPNPSTPFNGCTGLTSPNINDSTKTDFAKIPSKDMYGNSLITTGYTTSHIIDSRGRSSSIYNGTALNQTHKVTDYDWGLAFWNTADNAAANIRADSNLSKRTGDSMNMQIAIYTIGYLGTDGVDDALLKRIANDKSSTSYNASQATGLFVPASDPNALSTAFDTIASVILRLAQ